MQTNWQSYIVGGAVRDRLLGLPVYDYDHVVVGATPQDLIDLGYTQVGKDFPVFLHPQSKEEYALARTERKAGKGYTGFTVHAAPSVTLEEDLERRDLTINAMAESKDGQFIDPFNGQQDIRQRLLRHVSPAFVEDPLRVIRLARFRAHLGHLGFQIDSATKQLAQQLVASGELQEIAIQRLWHETYKALQTPSPWEYFATLVELGALAQIAPPLAKLLLSKRNPLGLLKLACEQLTDPNDRLAILLHSLNKPQQEALGKDLSLPKSTLSLCVQLSMHQRKLLHYPQLDPTQRFMLLHNCGALKDTSLINRLIMLCGIIHSQGQMELPDLSFGSSLQQIIDADLLTIKTVTAQQYISQGLEGKALGEALKAGQIAALAATI